MQTSALLPDLACDVLVIGTGAAGLTAALTAAAAGCRVIIAEKTGLIGGTTALSGAAAWVPANHLATAAGIADSAEEALAHIRAAAPAGRSAGSLCARMPRPKRC